jgi:hypothetical protein
MPGRHSYLTVLCVALPILVPGGVDGREDPSVLCLQAASEASARTGVPYDVLRAIATVETGRMGRPWPWTVNFGGDGQWYDSADEAEAQVTEAIRRGATNVDLGCFQLNYRWHAAGFPSIVDMLDPLQNATYAAEFLSAHFSRTGDWALAAAAYHSATPEYAEAYMARFETVYAGLASGETAPSDTAPRPIERDNRFPLLMAGATGSAGSIVPASVGGTRLIGEP